MKRVAILFFIFTITLSVAQALTLQESIGLALKNNPSVIASQKKVDAAQARLNQAVGAFFPTIKLDGNYGRSYTQPSTVQIATKEGASPQTFTFGTDAATDTRGLTASLSQPMFVAALFPGFKIAQRSADMAKEDFNKTVLDTSFSVTQAYFGVLKAEKFLKLAQESKEMAQSHLNQVKALLSAGVATQADLLRAEVQVANSEVALTKALNAMQIAKGIFNNALGKGLEEEVKLSEEKFSSEIGVLPNYDELVKLAFENRPDWKQFVLTKQIGEDNLRVAQTAYLPTVMLTGSIGNRITEYPTYKSDVNSWAMTGAASWTLFDGLGIQNRIREAAANLDAQKATEDQVKNGILLEVRDAYFNLKNSVETITSTKKAVDSAEENYKVSELRYKAGVGTTLEEIDAQVTLTQARVNHLQALFDVEIAKAKINKVVGREIL